MKTYDFHHLNHIKIQQHSKKALWTTLILTLFFTIVEIVGGILSNSLALLSDSAHMLSDVFALGLSMTAIYLSTRNPTKKYTFGFLRFEIIASFINGLALIVISLGIFIEGIKRIITPTEIDFTLMLTVAIIGLIVNIVLTIVLSRSTKKEENLNITECTMAFYRGFIKFCRGYYLCFINLYNRYDDHRPDHQYDNWRRYFCWWYKNYL